MLLTLILGLILSITFYRVIKVPNKFDHVGFSFLLGLGLATLIVSMIGLVVKPTATQWELTSGKVHPIRYNKVINTDNVGQIKFIKSYDNKSGIIKEQKMVYYSRLESFVSFNNYGWQPSNDKNGNWEYRYLIILPKDTPRKDKLS